mgnify:CR=1 FL=1
MKRIILTLLITVTFLTSCEDVIEMDNRGFATAEGIYFTESGYEGLINANYSMLRELYGMQPYIYCAGTDLYAEGRSPEPLGLSQYTELGPASEDVDLIYNNAYKAIRMANTALFYSDITEQSSNISSRVGEVKYLRANAYFLLVQTYGGVPLILDQIDSPILEIERNTAEEVYTAIIKDLKEALLAVGIDTTSGRVNQRAVQHLLAKVYLTRGYESFGEANDFSNAASFADEAIAGQNLNLSFDELWDYTNRENEEVLFAVKYSTGSISADPTELGNQQARFFGPYMGGSEIAGQAPNRSYNLLATDFALRLFTPDDERYEASFMTEVYNPYFLEHVSSDLTAEGIRDFYEPYWFTPADSTAYVNSIIKLEDFEYHPYETTVGGIIVTGDYETIPLKKFDDPDAPFGQSTSALDIILSRLGETYLIAAEAYLQSGAPAIALQRLNVVRNRAGVADAELNDLDIDYILDERGRELFGEYHRWFDLKRTGKLVERASLHHPLIQEANFTGAAGELKILRPIPQTALDLNGNRDFAQNPAYN